MRNLSCLLFVLCLTMVSACSDGTGHKSGDTIVTQPQQPAPAPAPVPPQNQTTPPPTTTSFTAVCRRATEVPGGNFTFNWATSIPVGLASRVSFDSGSRVATTSIVGSGVSKGPFKFIGAQSGSAGSAGSLTFPANGSPLMMGFPVVPFGTIEGSSTEYVIANVTNLGGTGGDPSETFLCTKNVTRLFK